MGRLKFRKTFDRVLITREATRSYPRNGRRGAKIRDVCKILLDLFIRKLWYEKGRWEDGIVTLLRNDGPGWSEG